MGFIIDAAAAIAAEIFGTDPEERERTDIDIQARQEWTVFTARMPKESASAIGGIELVNEVIKMEGVVKENHRATSRITKNPVEFGPVIGDHKINEPRRFSLNATITDFPMDKPSYDWDADIAGQTYSRAAWTKLNEIREKSYPFLLTSGLQSYPNLLITSLTCSRTARNANALQVQIQFEEIIMVTAKSEQVRSTDVDGTTGEQLSPEKDGGDKVSDFVPVYDRGAADALRGAPYNG